MIKPAAGYRPLAYSSPEAVQTTGTVADLDPVIPQHRGERVAGELGTLIGIKDAGLAEPGERLAQRFEAQVRPYVPSSRFSVTTATTCLCPN